MKDHASERAMDPLLLPFLTAGDEREARQHMDQLIAHAAPGIARIARASRAPEDAFQEAAQRVVKQLREIRAYGNTNAIGNYLHYVQVVASRVVKGEIRQEQPLRRSLVDALRHVLKRAPSLATWECDGQKFCGLALWRGERPGVAAGERLTRLLEQPRALADTISPDRDPATLEYADLLQRLFEWIGHPIRFDQATRIVGGLRRIEEMSHFSVGEVAGRRLCEWLPDRRRRPDEQAEWRGFLERLWSQIVELPRLHRLAYLLNFTAADGQVELFWMYGVVSIRQIGAALEISEEQFARAWPLLNLSERMRSFVRACVSYEEKFSVLWQHLPLTDAAIAGLLGTERQKVINLRKAAGDRLSRLMSRAGTVVPKLR
jgi:hypothetical protein